MRSNWPGLPRPPFRSRRRASTRMSLTSELLPEPDTPVTQTNTPSGISTSMFLRLLWRAPRTTNRPRPFDVVRRVAGTSIRSAPARILAGQALRLGKDRRQGAGGDDPPAADARSRAEVDQVVGRPHRVLVVLDHDHRVALVAELGQRVQQPVVVAGVQADRGLVEDVEHAHQPAADLAGQADPLHLAAGERGRGAVQRQVVQPHVLEESQPAADLLERLGGDGRPGGVQRQGGEELLGLGDGQVRDLGQRALGEHRETCGEAEVTVTARGLRVEPPAAAGRAAQHPHVLLQLPALHAAAWSCGTGRAAWG